MKILCRTCGLPEEDHHDFDPKMPDGCVCPAGEWGPENVPDVCGIYMPPPKGERCSTCEHDKECHQCPT